jgi:hypothetical protein
MTRYTTHLNIPYPDYKEKPYDTTISLGTFEGFDQAIHDINVQVTDNIFDTIGTASAPGELRQNEGEEGSVATVKGFWDANDGGGGFFSWVVDATPPTDDGGTIIVPTGTPGGYWQRLFEGTIYNFKWFGGRSANPDNATYFNSMLASIGSNVATIYIPHDPGGASTSYTVSTDVTIPINVDLWIEKGAYINNTVGTTFVVNGNLFASIAQIFANAGTINFGNEITYSFPEWFGAAGDGTTDDTDALNEAAAVFSTEGTLFLTKVYKISGVVDCGFASVVGRNVYAKIINSDADSYLSLNNTAGGGVDARFAYLSNVEIEMVSGATIGIEIARNRIHSRGLRIIGTDTSPGTGSQKGIYFNCTNTAQAFHDFDEFRITKCYDAIYIGDSGETSTYFFNSNRIGTKQCYITTFTHGIYLQAGFTACTQNDFGGYFEIQTATGGDTTVHIYFDQQYNGNRFDMHRDGAGIDYLIYNTGDSGASGNLYYLNDSADYTTTGPGSSNSDVIINSEDVLTVARNNEYIIRAKLDTGWYGFQAGADDVTIDIVSKAFSGTPTSWRQLGSIGVQVRQKFIVYNNFTSKIHGWFSRTNVALRRATQFKLNQDYSVDDYEDFFITFELTTATRICTLPLTTNIDGFSYKIKNSTTSTQNLTVQVNNSPTETIEGGVASIVLTPGTSYEFALYGTVWYYH